MIDTKETIDTKEKIMIETDKLILVTITALTKKVARGHIPSPKKISALARLVDARTDMENRW